MSVGVMERVMGQDKWYFNILVLTIAIIFFGPFALPLVWMNPKLKKWLKIAITAAVAVMFLYFLYLSAEIVKAIIKEAAELERVMK